MKRRKKDAEGNKRERGDGKDNSERERKWRGSSAGRGYLCGRRREEKDPKVGIVVVGKKKERNGTNVCQAYRTKVLKMRTVERTESS